MAEIAKNGVPSTSSVLPPATNRLNELLAGEPIAAGDALYVKASDGRIWRASGAAANAAALYVGAAAAAASAGEAVTPYFGVCMRYGAALVPGTRYYVSGTVAGGLADAASVGGTVPVAFAVDATRIYWLPPNR
jgi:hypothetical protein